MVSVFKLSVDDIKDDIKSFKKWTSKRSNPFRTIYGKNFYVDTSNIYDRIIEIKDFKNNVICSFYDEGFIISQGKNIKFLLSNKDLVNFVATVDAKGIDFDNFYLENVCTSATEDTDVISTIPNTDNEDTIIQLRKENEILKNTITELKNKLAIYEDDGR